MMLVRQMFVECTCFGGGVGQQLDRQRVQVIETHLSQP